MARWACARLLASSRRQGLMMRGIAVEVDGLRRRVDVAGCNCK